MVVDRIEMVSLDKFDPLAFWGKLKFLEEEDQMIAYLLRERKKDI